MAKKTEQIQLRVSPEDKEAFVKEAKKDDRSLTNWILHVCKSAIRARQESES